MAFARFQENRFRIDGEITAAASRVVRRNAFPEFFKNIKPPYSAFTLF